MVTIYELFKDTIIGGAALVTSIVAYHGLQTWRTQLKGTVEYELTRRLLRSVYKYRDAFSIVRNPTMWGGEYTPPQSESKISREVAEHLGIAGAYEKRWKHVLDARSEMEREILEAEVIWDTNVRERFMPMFVLQGELFSTLHVYLASRDPRRTERERSVHQDLLQKRRDILYEIGIEEDLFSKELQLAIKGLESWLRPHLRK